jgi:hypothetical protein
MSRVLEQGADLIIRSGWRSVCWLDVDGTSLDIIAVLEKAGKADSIDRLIKIARVWANPLPFEFPSQFARLGLHLDSPKTAQ